MRLLLITLQKRSILIFKARAFFHFLMRRRFLICKLRAILSLISIFLHLPPRTLKRLFISFLSVFYFISPKILILKSMIIFEGPIILMRQFLLIFIISRSRFLFKIVFILVITFILV